MSDAFLVRRGGSGGSGFPQFTYTGDYLFINDGSGNWRLKLLTTGDLTFTKPNSAGKGIDVFLVGAGGSCYDGGGGGGGYTKTVRNLPIDKNVVYPITIGSPSLGSDGGDTSAFGQIAGGGKAGGLAVRWQGGYGGSGGGDWGNSGGNGGSDGGNGTNSSGGTGGLGQGSTTREFGEPDGNLYSGGGGSPGNGVGGAGGGADAFCSAEPNTGGGSGGTNNGPTTMGGSGIVVLRNKREVHE